jgi:hypothetical protein
VNYKIRNSEGYKAAIVKNGRSLERSFLNKTKTMDEKLELAKKALKHITKNYDREIAKVDRNKQSVKLDHNGDELPKGITKTVGRGSEGYRISYKVAGKIKTTRITNSSLTMNKKLEKAKKLLKQFSQ